AHADRKRADGELPGGRGLLEGLMQMSRESQEITKAESEPAPSALPATRGDVASFALEFGKAWEYVPAPETADHVKIEPRYDLFVGGKWRAPKSGKYFATVSPSTEEKL